MKSKIVASMAAAATLAVAAGAYAGTLPAPFTNGNIPLDKDMLKYEAGLTKAIGKALSGSAGCYSKGVGNVFKGKPDGVQACLGGLNTGTGTIGKTAVKLLPLLAPGSCQLDNLGAVLPPLLLLVPSITPVVLCDGTEDLDARADALTTRICTNDVGGAACTADGDCGTMTGCSAASFGAGAKIPGTKDSLKVETSAFGIGVKYSAAALKCLDKAVGAEFKAPGSSDPQGCIDAAAVKATEGLAKLQAKSGALAPCVFADPALLPGILDQLGDAAVVIADAIYCDGGM